LIHFAPVMTELVDGENPIEVRVTDQDGNQTFAVILVIANLVPDGPIPVPGVSLLCSEGEFAPKSELRLGLSINPGDSSLNTILAGFDSLGVTPTIYSDEEIAAGLPAEDGVTVLAISRKVLVDPVSAAYVEGVRSFVAQGGSVMGEYDGAALVFSNFEGTNTVIPNLTPPIQLFEGYVTGGGALLPIMNSTIYVSDPNDPIMAGMPPSFLVGVRAAFAITSFNDSWLHTSATFTSSGQLGLVPSGTYPAVMSGRCGAGRVVLFTSNHFQVMRNVPVNTMIGNALSWLIGE
jgi:hypothetical protein